MRYNYNKNEIDLLLDNMVILVDTREKKNQHITSVWDKQGIKYKSMKLDQADYSQFHPFNWDREKQQRLE